MLTIRRGLVVAALVAAGVSVPALPASAHTGAFERDCDSVTLHLTVFANSSEEDPNVVDVFRGDEKIDTITFTGRQTTKEYPETSDEAVTYRASWTKTGADNHSGNAKATLEQPGDCQPPAPECVEEGEFSYTFDGAAGSAMVTLAGDTPLCEPAAALLVAYETEGADLASSGQHTVFSADGTDIVEAGDYTLQVDLPDCFFEVDLYFFPSAEDVAEPANFTAPENPLAESLASTVLGPKDAPPTTFNAGEQCPSTPPTVSPTSPAPPPQASDDSLAKTGVSNTVPLVGIGALLLIGGAAMLFVTRRRRATATGGTSSDG